MLRGGRQGTQLHFRRRLHFVQSDVSATIKALEAELRARPLEGSSRRVELVGDRQERSIG